MHDFFEKQTVCGAKNAPLPEFIAARVDSFFNDRVAEAWGGRHIMRGRQPGPDALHLSINDYLSISKHPNILDAMRESIASNGNGLLMSGVFVHGDNPLLSLEDRFASFLQSEASILCQSGYAANTGLLQSIASPETLVYLDMMAHMSLWEGVRAAGARAIVFSHNDADHLGRQIQRNGPGVVIVDSIYSTNGSVCPLTDIVETALAHGCVLVVDESHSLGTHGPGGAGLVVELGLADRVHFRTASLAKAFAGRAGIISCSARFREYFKCESRPAIFSSTLLPHEIAGLDATISVIECEAWRRASLASNAQYLRTRLASLGYNVSSSASQIIALEAGTEQRTMVLRDALESRAVFGSVFCAPATANTRALVRLSVHAALTREQLRRIVDVCEAIRQEVRLDDWASTRRMRAATRVMVDQEAAQCAA